METTENAIHPKKTVLRPYFLLHPQRKIKKKRKGTNKSHTNLRVTHCLKKHPKTQEIILDAMKVLFVPLSENAQRQIYYHIENYIGIWVHIVLYDRVSRSHISVEKATKRIWRFCDMKNSGFTVKRISPYTGNPVPLSLPYRAFIKNAQITELVARLATLFPKKLSSDYLTNELKPEVQAIEVQILLLAERIVKNGFRLGLLN